MSSEKITSTAEKHPDHEALKQEAAEQHERMREDLERKNEKSQETNVEQATHEALEKATSRHEVEQTAAEKQPEKAPERRLGAPSKREREASFKATMKEVQSELSAPSRSFSKLIHNKTVEKMSEGVGSTIARPNAILSGAVFAFGLTLVIYLLAKNFGYPLSGFETIGSFALGWVLGITFDFLRTMVTGRR